jgi:hypothetical protein
MNIAFFIRSAILDPLQSLMRWWTTGASAAAHCSTSKHQAHEYAIQSIASSGLVTRATGQIIKGQKPLRVVRVVEAGQTRASVGRMVISGRMADVCAELDRLAAGEAALS